MKKVISFGMALLLIIVFSLSTSALKDSDGTEYYEVVIDAKLNDNGIVRTELVLKGDTIVVGSTNSIGEDVSFLGISFFKDAACKDIARLGIDFQLVCIELTKTNEMAVEGKDYKIDKEKVQVISLRGQLLTVEVMPLTDILYVTGIYKNISSGTIETPGFEGVMSPATGGFNIGDVNLDCSVDVSDLATLKKIIANLIESYDTVNPDVDNNDVVDVADLAYLKKLIAGLVEIPE